MKEGSRFLLAKVERINPSFKKKKTVLHRTSKDERFCVCVRFGHQHGDLVQLFGLDGLLVLLIWRKS